MTPPLIATSPAPLPHPRGIYQADHTFPGVSTFRIYSCSGRLLERREIETELMDGQVRASMEWTLEHHCPSDPVRHAVTCCDGHGQTQLRVLK